MLAIGGTGMAPLACLLRQLGHEVRGVDGPLYPPMSTLLADAGIEPQVGFDLSALDPKPDLVVVGNAVPRHNPLAQAVEASGIERISMPQALARFVLAGRRPLVVAGSHGKTTTTALLAWVHERAQWSPGYLIGGAPLDLPASFALGTGERFLLEGDEYNAAYFDRGAKFLHYGAETVILTSAEYDHADLYHTEQAFQEAFRRLLAQLPATGRVIACADSTEVRDLVADAGCAASWYGLEDGPPGTLRPLALTLDENGTRFVVDDVKAGPVEVRLRLHGPHNLSNALAVWAACRADGLPVDALVAGLESFRGVRRRTEELGSAAGATIVDDFAHHPSEVQQSIRGLRQRYPNRRLVVLFEPRSLTASRNLHLDAYSTALSLADAILLAPLFHAQRLEPEDRLDRAALVRALRGRGREARAFSSVDELNEAVLAMRQQGDVIACMSSGSFEGLPTRLLRQLVDAERS